MFQRPTCIPQSPKSLLQMAVLSGNIHVVSGIGRMASGK
jgi:hypothetical protein